MFLAEEMVFNALDDAEIIDKRFPIWWSNGFEDRRYVEPGEFFGNLVDFEGERVQLGEDNENIRFTVLKQDLYGVDAPFFVTVQPL